MSNQKRYRQQLLFIIILLITGLFPTMLFAGQASENYFIDVSETYWAFKYVQKMYDEGITTGYPDGTYRPAVDVNRAQMAAFIARAKFGESFTYNVTPHFIDVPETYWAFKYVQKMYEEGITTGYPDGTYRPAVDVNRAQMAAFISRAFLGIL